MRTAYSLEIGEFERLKGLLDLVASVHLQYPNRASPIYQVDRDHLTNPPRYETWHFHSATLFLNRNSEESLVIYSEDEHQDWRHASLLKNISQIPIKMTPIKQE